MAITVTGAKDKIVEMIDRRGEGHVHNGEEALARQAARALAALERGETSVEVGHYLYVVKPEAD